MQQKINEFIELKVNRDFGGIISAYFDFLKQNIKKFTHIFLSYNGIFLIGLLVVSYLLVTGFIGMIRSNEFNTFDDGGAADETYVFYLVSGGILFLLLFFIVAFLNYSLAGAYILRYEQRKGMSFDRKEVWQLVKDNFGQVLLFVLLLIPIYILFIIVYVIIGLIPLIGFIANLFGQYVMAAWIGVSFFALLVEQKGVGDAFREGWALVNKSLWQCLGVNFVLGLLNGILVMLVMIIPGILIGVYTYHVVSNDVDVAGGILPTIIYTLGLSAFLLVAVYAQSLTQFVNGILYFALHEKTYNTNTRGKIEQIGKLD